MKALAASIADWIGLPFMLSEASIRSTTPLVPLSGASTPTAATGAPFSVILTWFGVRVRWLGSWSRYSRSGKPVLGASLSVGVCPSPSAGTQRAATAAPAMAIRRCVPTRGILMQ